MIAGNRWGGIENGEDIIIYSGYNTLYEDVQKHKPRRRKDPRPVELIVHHVSNGTRSSNNVSATADTPH